MRMPCCLPYHCCCCCQALKRQEEEEDEGLTPDQLAARMKADGIVLQLKAQPSGGKGGRGGASGRGRGGGRSGGGGQRQRTQRGQGAGPRKVE